jgi:hypothetical protein
MKRSRSALPLPRYVLPKPLKSGWGYFFNVPMWARKAGCPMTNEPLGTDYAKAVERAETVLLPAFDSWRTGGQSDETPPVAAFGTLDWIFAEYRADRRFTRLDARTKRNHEVGFRMVGGHILKDGRKLGGVRIAAIDTALIGWEWLQREIDIFATFEVTHYRPKERPNAVRVIHEKTNEENWIPLLDDKTGAPFYPGRQSGENRPALPDGLITRTMSV